MSPGSSDSVDLSMKQRTHIHKSQVENKRKERERGEERGKEKGERVKKKKKKKNFNLGFWTGTLSVQPEIPVANVLKVRKELTDRDFLHHPVKLKV